MEAVSAHIDKLVKDGYTVIPDALSGEEVETTELAVQELLDTEAHVARSTGTQTDNLRNAHAIVGKHPHFYEFFLNPPVMVLVRSVLGEDV